MTKLIPEYVSKGKASSSLYTKIRYYQEDIERLVLEKQLAVRQAEQIKAKINGG